MIIVTEKKESNHEGADVKWRLRNKSARPCAAAV